MWVIIVGNDGTGNVLFLDFVVIREFWEVICLKLMCTVCVGKVSSVGNGLQFTGGLYVLRLVRESTWVFFACCFLDVYYYYYFLVSIYELCIRISLRLSTVKIFDDVDLIVLSILVCFHRLYFGEGVSKFWKLWISGKCVIGSGMVISNLVVFMFRSESVFGILFCVLCNSVYGWEELKLLGLDIMFVMVDGDGFF